MGRAPCCDKANVKKGPWSPEEDAKLKSYIDQNGTGGNWIALPQKIGLKRCGKSCRLRWLNYLRPNIKHGGFSEEEDNLICSLYISIGSRWSIIAAQLPGRTDNDIKNYWNTRLKKKLLGKQRKDHHRRPTTSAAGAPKRSSSSSHLAATASDHGDGSPPNTTIMSSAGSDITVHDSIVVNNNNNLLLHHHHHYWPAGLPPIPYSSEEPRLNDHASIRKLLIKLGGRFSNSSPAATTPPTTTTTNTDPNHHHHQQHHVQFQGYDDYDQSPAAAAGHTISSTNGVLSPRSSASVEGSEVPLLALQPEGGLGLEHHDHEYYSAGETGLDEMLQGKSSNGGGQGHEAAAGGRVEYGLEFLLSGSNHDLHYQQGQGNIVTIVDMMMAASSHHQLVYGDHDHNYGFDDDLRAYTEPEAGSM